MLLRRRLLWFATVVACIVAGLDVSAQDRGDRGDRGDRDRGSDRGSYGGRGGSDRGGYGGAPGGYGGAPSGYGGAPGGYGGAPGRPPGGYGGGYGGPPGGFGGGYGGPPGGFGGGYGGPPGGFGGPSGGFSGSMEDRASRFAAMMDRDGNGKLDQEEIDRMPSFFKDMMKSRGVEMRAGLSVEDMKKGVFSGSSGGDGRNSSSSRNGDRTTLRPYRQKEKARITMDLPPKYSELDTDFDGQVAFHEWLASSREDIEKFYEIDVNQDAFLTPQELQDYEDSAALQEEIEFLYASLQKERLIIVNAGSNSSRSSDRGSNNNDRSSDRSSDRSRSEGSRDSRSSTFETAQRYFSSMDRNQNGTLDMEEWDQSRRLRPMFEEAGIRIVPMNRDEFARNYERAAGR